MFYFFAKKLEEWLKHVLTVYCFYRKLYGTFPKTYYLNAKERCSYAEKTKIASAKTEWIKVTSFMTNFSCAFGDRGIDIAGFKTNSLRLVFVAMLSNKKQ